MRVSQERLYICDETGEYGSPYCWGAREKMQNSRVVLAVRYKFHLNGCICGKEGRSWREATSEEGARFMERERRRAAEAIERALVDGGYTSE